MNRPTLEVADIIRASGNSYFERHRSHMAWQHLKVLDAIVRCRTPALGAHRDQCSRCGHQAISYNSCRNRHCPKCQGNAHGPSGWLRVPLNCCLCLTSMLFSHCRMSYPH